MCTFTKRFAGSPGLLLAKAREAIESEKGKFSGDEARGSFAAPTGVGDVKGSYEVDGQTLKIKIDAKPWVASCDQISKQLDEWLGPQPRAQCATCKAAAHA